jgi:hypothetical protein
MNQQSQIEQNFQVFEQRLPALLKTHRGQFALMRDGEIVEFFDTARDAYVAGQKLFAQDNLFSIQEVIATPADLGWFSHALPQ